MKVAALYDIHGNLPALEAVLEEIRQAGVDHIVVGGDVLPGPMPRETLTRLRDLDIPVQFIRGNGEREILEQRAGRVPAVPEQFQEVMRWVAEQLDPEHEQWLAGWPQTLHMEIPGLGEVLFCHATPRSDTEIFTRLTQEDRLLPIFEGVNAPLVVCGHTHMQFDRTVGGIRVVNAGSVGMPFGQPGAYWLLLGPDVQLRQTSYDLTQAAERIRGTKYPQAQEFAAGNVLQPPSEEATLKLFEPDATLVTPPAASPAALVDTDDSWRVPPEYRGPLKFLAHLIIFGVLIDHVLVRGCATDHTVRTSSPLRQDLPTAALILPQPRLRVLYCRWFLNHGFETIEGEVENLAQAPIDRVMAVASFYDAQGVHVEDQASVLRYSQLQQRSSFRIVVPHNPRLETLTLSFRFLAGGAVTAEPSPDVDGVSPDSPLQRTTPW